MVTFTFFKTTKLIQIDTPDLVVDMQDIVDAIRDFEDSLPMMDFQKIMNGTGKDDLGFAKTTLTVTLVNDWRIKFEDRAGPARVDGFINGGNLVAINSFANKPITGGAFVDVTIAQAVRISCATAGLLGAADQDATTQERAHREHNRTRMKPETEPGHNTRYTLALNNQVFDGLLKD